MTGEDAAQITDRPVAPHKHADCATGACPLSGRFSWLIWILVFAALIFMQWPMLKGLFYDVTGIPATESSIPWQNDLPAALAEAKTSKKLVLVDFSASWCPPCRVMKHDVWPVGEVEAAVSKNFIPVLIDVDAPDSDKVATRYGVSGIPAVLILDEHGDVLRRRGFMTSSQALEFLEQSRR